MSEVEKGFKDCFLYFGNWKLRQIQQKFNESTRCARWFNCCNRITLKVISCSSLTCSSMLSWWNFIIFIFYHFIEFMFVSEREKVGAALIWVSCFHFWLSLKLFFLSFVKPPTLGASILFLLISVLTIMCIEKL